MNWHKFFLKHFRYFFSLLIFSSPIHSVACEFVNVVGTAQKARWCLTVAKTPETRRSGLQNVKSLKPNSGMLFVFKRPTLQFFWMKNTPLSLDLIFADASGIITKIIRDARPYDETILAGGCAQYVVEVKAGASINIEKGDRLIFKNLPAVKGGVDGEEDNNCL